MRLEMEETHRQSLETRLAIEEAYAAYAKSAGIEVAQAGVEDRRLPPAPSQGVGDGLAGPSIDGESSLCARVTR